MDDRTRRRNRTVMLSLFGLVVGMIGLAYASVPLYTLFCQVTGYGGTTQRAEAGAGATLDRTIRVRFNADVNHSLPWSFHPNQREVTLKVGETYLASYRADNRTDRPTVGTAVYNVTPEKAGAYFNKIECFCFTEQILQPGQSVDMPVAFFVDPSIADDPNLDDVTTITLSYTFYRAKDADAVLAQAPETTQSNENRRATTPATN
ncbi:cytochrome c oxidase assembly protein [Azospirillum sp. ST 5-10]|uniref:cytochrome c oxidase assembly protein n=1 Tax=unclassified Azospirillum TaxID=2630922 RepID=UPI003F4A7576